MCLAIVDFYRRKSLLYKITFIILACFIPLSLMFAFYTVQHVQIKGPIHNWSTLQLHRKAIVRSACVKYNLTTPNITLDYDMAKGLYVEHNYKLIYCEVPKAGCSNWKRILILLQMNVTSVNPGNISHETVHYNSPVKPLSSYSRDQWLPLLNRYTKVMFTRDPFERLVSAYRNKFLHNNKKNYYGFKIANEIRRKFRMDKNSTEKVTFQEFIQYVLSGNPAKSDPHWRPMHHLCDPCNIHYDVLGKLSTIDEDYAQVLRIIRAPRNLHFPNIRQYASEALTDLNVTKSYLTKLSNEYMQKIRSHYQLDAILFDYPIYPIDTTSQELQ